jgi:hypothetical protein
VAALLLLSLGQRRLVSTPPPPPRPSAAAGLPTRMRPEPLIALDRGAQDAAVSCSRAQARTEATRSVQADDH